MLISPLKVLSPLGGSSGSSWTPQAEYLTVKAAMTTEPSLADQKIQDAWVKGFKTLGVWNKAIVLDNFACATQQSSLLNWKSPGTYDPTKQNSPLFIVNKGWKGITGTGCIALNFTPSINGAGFLGQNDITFIIGINEEGSGWVDDFGSKINTKDIRVALKDPSAIGASNCHILINGGQVNFDTTTSRQYITGTRSSANSIDIYKNLVKKVAVSNSVGLCDSSLWAVGEDTYSQSDKTESFVLIFKALTETEVQGVIRACDEYLAHYNNKIRQFQTKIELNLVAEGHSFVENFGFSLGLEEKSNTRISSNFGVGGNVIADLVTRQATIDAKLITETSTYKNILVLWIGVNEVREVVGQGLTAYNALKSYVLARVAVGWKVFVYTMTPATVYDGRAAQFETERGVFNGLMRSDLALMSNVYIMDTDTIPEMDTPADVTNSTYWANTLHLNTTGLILATGLFATKINQLYG